MEFTFLLDREPLQFEPRMLRHAAARALSAAALREQLRIHQPYLLPLRAGLATDPHRSSNGGEEEGAISSTSTSSSSSWLPSFDRLRRRLPAALGGDRLSGDLSFEEFITSLSRARRLGGLTGSAFGTSAVVSIGFLVFFLSFPPSLSSSHASPPATLTRSLDATHTRTAPGHAEP